VERLQKQEETTLPYLKERVDKPKKRFEEAKLRETPRASVL